MEIATRTSSQHPVLKELKSLAYAPISTFRTLPLFETDAFLKEAQPWQELEPKVFLAYCPQVRFGQAYQYLFSYPNLDLIIDATATELVCEEGSARVREVVCKASDGTIVRLRARAFVLAAGAIENARLLLNSKSSTPQGLGNEHDQVGRYLMNHPKGYIGRVRLRESDYRSSENELRTSDTVLSFWL